MAEGKLERVYTVPLSKAYEYLRTRRAERAVNILRAFAARHMKVELEDVRISEGVNSLIWRDSIQKPPRKVKVRVVRDAQVARVWLLGEEEELKKKLDARKAEEEAKRKAEEQKKEKKTEGKKAAGAKDIPEKQPEEKKTEAKAPALKASDSNPNMTAAAGRKDSMKPNSV